MRAAVGDPHEAAIVLALHTGLREGELFGLQWQDVDLERATVTVRQTLIHVTGGGLQASQPKTEASAATIPLTAGAVAALRANRTRQIEQRLRAGSAWQDAGYVFTTEAGTPVRASNFMRRHFYPIAERAGIPTRRQPDGSQRVRFHDLRYGCGSLLISLGVKPKIVQTILRHSRLATTMDLYVHAYDEDLREAVGTLDRALGS
jgi:integrase